MSLKVYFPKSPYTGKLTHLKSKLPDGIEIKVGPEDAPDLETQIMVTGRPSREQVEACPQLQVLIVPWAGIPEKTRELMLDYPHISVHNLHHNAAQTAEMAVTLLMAAAKLLVPMDQALRKNDWRPRYWPDRAILLDGKTALILGFGHIGQHTGRICQGLGMRVIATRRKPDRPHYLNVQAEIYPPDALPDLLPKANTLLITLPLTDETRGLIGERELALLPSNSILVNIARGPIVEEEALYVALKNGTLGAAGLEVWYNYPESEESRVNTPPSKFPFHELENVVMSPHRGGSVIERAEQRMERLAELLNAVNSGDPIPNRVDLSAGY